MGDPFTDVTLNDPPEVPYLGKAEPDRCNLCGMTRAGHYFIKQEHRFILRPKKGKS